MEGQGDLVSRLIIEIIRITIWVRGVIIYLLSPPDPPSIVETPTVDAGFKVLEVGGHGCHVFGSREFIQLRAWCTDAYSVAAVTRL